MSGEVYLHDGLYASFDGWQIILRAPREGGDHWIGLEPETMRALMRFLRALEAEHGDVPVAAAAADKS
jgi:sialic acid synthase SpsE